MPPVPTPPAPPAGDPPQTPPAPAPPAPAPSDDWTPPSREEWEAQQRAVTEANQRARRLEQQQRKAADAAAQAAGNYEDLYKSEQERATKLLEGLSTRAVDGAIAEVARSLNFRNPLLAGRLIDRAGLEATVDEATYAVDVPAPTRTLIEQRLREAATSDPYLTSEPPARQAPGAGNPPAGPNAPANGAAAMNQMIRRAAGRG